MKKTTYIYIAGPLFSVSEREFNKMLARVLKTRIKNCIIVLPQEFSSTVLGKSGFLKKVFNYSLKSIIKSDVVIAILDGPDADSGTCVEIGYAYANKKPIIGIRTDFRSSEDRGLNLMVSQACNQLIWLKDSSIELDRVFNEVVRAVNNFLPNINSIDKTR